MPRSPWLVPVTALRRAPGARQEEHRAGPVGRLSVAGTTVEEGAEVRADVVLDAIDGGIEVAGTVTVPWHAECRRCLAEVHGTTTAGVRELYAPPGRTGAEVEAGAEDEETYTLTGEVLDLAPLVRDAVLLGLPLAPLCDEACAGLCPTCGAALAAGPCGCAPAPADPRWAALDALKPHGAG